ncbi:FkbM family methyltransferase [Halobacteriovorax sp. HLS]|uniref:FkbM family methyltransferase n=1 Tax=Halobacteriovorax sp. HLS TaxID=2234000 RepID=UPI000FD71750|nr:FkbM family methyltransferase [Halobacteriovorax sp. HLS]
MQLRLIKKLPRKIILNRYTKAPLSSLFRTVFLLSSANTWSSLIASKLTNLTFKIKFDSDTLQLICSNPLLLWRAKTFFKKEPETLEWINSFSPNSIVWDVGANIGLYTIYAGKKGHNVLAFEPESSNYSTLNGNIRNNRLDKTVKAYCMAISDTNIIDTLRLSSIENGAALHSFSENIGQSGNEFQPICEQGCFSYSLDQLITEKKLACPNYLKIDVDGLEYKIITGANKLLNRPELKEILMEVNENSERDRKLVEQILSNSFIIKEKGKSFHNPHDGSAMTNYIFKKEV